MLSRDQILSADDLPMENVDVPEWGGSVCVRTITGAERDAYEIALYEKRKKNAPETQMRASLLALCLCDESGARLFAEGDVESLGNKSARALDRLYDVAIRLNRIGEGDADTEKN